MTGLRAGLAAWIGQRFFFGWVILAVAALGIFVSGPGQSHTIGVFFGPIAQELDLTAGLAGQLMLWLGLGGAADLSRTVLSFAYGAATLVAAFLLPQMGRLVDRHGPRRKNRAGLRFQAGLGPAAQPSSGRRSGVRRRQLRSRPARPTSRSRKRSDEAQRVAAPKASRPSSRYLLDSDCGARYVAFLRNQRRRESCKLLAKLLNFKLSTFG